MGKVNQALQTLEKHKSVLDQSLVNLSALEFENLVTLEEVAMVLQRSEVVLRIAEIVEQYVVELGGRGQFNRHAAGGVAGQPHGGSAAAGYGLLPWSARRAKKVLQPAGKSSRRRTEGLAILANFWGMKTLTWSQPGSPGVTGFYIKFRAFPRGLLIMWCRTWAALKEIDFASRKVGPVEGIGEVRARSISRGLKRLREQCLMERHI
jgi:diadenylate cyclase